MQKNSYASKPIVSVLGDSISSYYGYENVVYYGPLGVRDINPMAKDKTWWSLYSERNGYTIGWVGAVSGSQVALPTDSYYSLNNIRRIGNLGLNGTPDIVAVYGGINDALTWCTIDGSTFAAQYRLLVDKLHSLYEDVHLLLVSPYYFQNEWGDNNLVNEYASIIFRIARENNDDYVDLRGQTSILTDYCDNIYIHPNESGMRKIADAIETAIGKTGINNIKFELDYDYYIVKVIAHDNNYDNLRFKFRLVNNSSNEEIYNTDWQTDNCFILENVDPNATYFAYAEIDNNGDGIAEDTESKDISNLVVKRSGTTMYNGVDYSDVYDFNYYVENNQCVYDSYRNNPYAAIEHFVNSGESEGLRAKDSFNVDSYKNANPPLRKAYGNKLMMYYWHYMNYGKKDGWPGATGYEDIIIY